MDFGRDLVALFINSLTLVYTVMIIAYALQTFVPIGFSAPVMAVRRDMTSASGKAAKPS